MLANGEKQVFPLCDRILCPMGIHLGAAALGGCSGCVFPEIDEVGQLHAGVFFFLLVAPLGTEALTES